MRCIVVGAGAAGLMAAGTLAKNGHNVILLEKNEKVGKKLFISGKGRCNVTNMSEIEDLISNIVSNPKFVLSSLSKFSQYDTYAFFEDRGVPLKVERGNRVFPQSNKSSDIIKCLEKYIKENGVDLRLKTNVENIIVNNNKVVGVVANGIQLQSDIVVIATGGVSYHTTGSTGDGYRFARQVGHNIVELKPALSGLITNGDNNLAGLSLKNAKATICVDNNIEYSDFGEMLFTHNGVSGPIILSLSSKINKYYINGKFKNSINLFIDLKPVLDFETLENRMIKDFSLKPNMIIKNVLQEYMPKSLIPLYLKQCLLNEEVKCNSITKKTRQKMITVMKGLKFKILDMENIDQAIVTAGGVDVKEISPKDMQSKIVKNLYFIGEVLDVDALTGGFNIQLAFSTANAMANSLK